MSNNIVQLTDYNDNNIYPIAGAAAEGSITKTMLDEGVFVGAELSDPGNIAYVGTADIQDNAVTAPKLGIPCPVISENLSEPSSVAYVATDNIQDGAVTSDKIDWTTIGPIAVAARGDSSKTLGNTYTLLSSVTAKKNDDILGRILFTNTGSSTASVQFTFSTSSTADSGIFEYQQITLAPNQSVTGVGWSRFTASDSATIYMHARANSGTVSTQYFGLIKINNNGVTP